MMVGSAWPKLLTTAFLFNWLGSQFVYLSKESYLLKAWHACSLLPVRGVDVTSFLLLKGVSPFLDEVTGDMKYQVCVKKLAI